MQLAEHFNAECVAGTIASRADAVDYLTWTFLFRRLLANPSYYDLEGTDADSVNVFLSALVEDTLTDLEVTRNFVFCYSKVCVSSINQARCLQEAGCVELGKEAKAKKAALVQTKTPVSQPPCLVFAGGEVRGTEEGWGTGVQCCNIKPSGTSLDV